MKSVLERLVYHVNKTSDCWEWKGCKTSFGYGRIMIKGKSKLAHRIHWEEINGKILNNLCVLHKCNNPSCIKIDHLFLGTYSDNLIDCFKKGRRPHGHKLRIEDVRTIRIMSKTKTQKEIAKLFNIHNSSVSSILSNRYWNNIL